MTQENSIDSQDSYEEIQGTYLVPCDPGGNELTDEPGILINSYPREFAGNMDFKYTDFSIRDIPLNNLIQTGSELADYMYLNRHIIVEAIGKPEYIKNLKNGQWKMLQRRSDGLLTGTLVDTTGTSSRFRGQLGFRENQYLKPKALVGSVFNVMSLVTAQYYLADISKQLTEIDMLVKENINRGQNHNLGRIIGAKTRLVNLAKLLEAGYHNTDDIDMGLVNIEQDLSNSIAESLLNIKQNTAINEFGRLKKAFEDQNSLPDIMKSLPFYSALETIFGKPLAAYFCLSPATTTYLIKERELSQDRKMIYRSGEWERGIKDILMVLLCVDAYQLYYQLRIQSMIINDSLSDATLNLLNNQLQDINKYDLEGKQLVQTIGDVLTAANDFNEPFFNMGNKNKRKRLLETLTPKYQSILATQKPNKPQYLRIEVQIDEKEQLIANGGIFQDLPPRLVVI